MQHAISHLMKLCAPLISDSAVIWLQNKLLPSGNLICIIIAWLTYAMLQLLTGYIPFGIYIYIYIQR